MKLHYNDRIYDISDIVFEDDTVAVFYNKVASLLKLNHTSFEIHTWIDIQSPREVYLHDFIKTMLESFDYEDVLTHEIEKYVKANLKCTKPFHLSAAITSQSIYNSLLQAKPVSCKKVLNDEDKLVDEYNTTAFYCIDSKETNGVRHVSEGYLKNTVDIKKTEFSNIDYSIAIWNYRFKPLHQVASKNIDLNDLFTKFSMSYNIPFAKLIKSSEHISIKMNKEFVRETDRKKLRLWSKNNRAYYANSRKDLIVIRVPSPKDNVGITVTIHPEGYVDIKLNLVNSKTTPQKVMRTLQPMLFNFFDMYNISHLLYVGTVKNIKIKGHMGMSQPFTEEFLKTHLNPDIFGYLGRDKKYFDILLKKNSGFYSFQNIVRTINTFKIKVNSPASKLFFPEISSEKLKQINSTINKNSFYKSNIQDIIIKLKSNRNGVDFYVSGLKYDKELERSLKYIYYIFHNSNEHVPQKNIEKKIEDNHDDYVGIFDDDEDDEDNDDNVGDDNDGDDNDVGDFNIGDISECPPPPTQKRKDKKDKKNSEKYERVHINDLKDADSALFTFSGNKDFGTYAKKCQRARQPIVLSKANVDRTTKCFPDALKNIKQYGSTTELKSRNYYACPAIWCPRSKIAMSPDDFEKYGKRCPYPDIDEEPVVKGDLNYYVDHPKKSSHPQGYDLPCCFNKPQHAETQQDTNTKVALTSKYILDEDWPIPDGRYGVVPRSLEKLFDNKFCGDPSGRQGNIKSGKTNCYVKVGVNMTQPFLSCLANLLDLSSWEDIVKKLYNEVTFSKFMTTQLYQYFIPSEYDTYNDYSFFKKWYNKQEEYFKLFKISKSLIEEVQLPQQSVPTKSMKNYDTIRREYLFYKSFMRFKNYLKDEGIPKTPDMILPLLGIFYKTNVLILDASKEDVSYVNCDSVYSYINPFIVIINNGAFYEYVVHLAADSGKLVETKVFFYEQARFIQSIMSACFEKKLTDSVVSEQKMLFHLRDDVRNLVIDYDMKVIGIIVKQVYYPFTKWRSSQYYSDNINSKCKYVYSTDVNLSKLKPLAASEWKYMNKILNEDYYDKDNSKINISESNKDNLSILLGDHDIDERVTTISKRDYRYKIFVLMINEIVKVKNTSQQHNEVIEFIRHEANPMSYNQKYHYLMTQFSPLFETLIQKSTINIYPITSNNMNVCSDNNTNKEVCNTNSHCIYDSVKKLCKMKVAKEDHQYLIERVIDYLIYSTNNVDSPIHISPDIVYYDNILVSNKTENEIDKYVNDVQVNVFETVGDIKSVTNDTKNLYSNIYNDGNNLLGISDKKLDLKVNVGIVKNVEIYEVNSLQKLVSSLVPLVGPREKVTKVLKIEDIPTKLNTNIILLTKNGKKLEKEVIGNSHIYTYIIFYRSKETTYIVRKLSGRVIFRELDLIR